MVDIFLDTTAGMQEISELKTCFEKKNVIV